MLSCTTVLDINFVNNIHTYFYPTIGGEFRGDGSTGHIVTDRYAPDQTGES